MAKRGLSADEIIHRLKLEPHPEGGFYRESYRARETIAGEALPLRYESARTMSTAIYYLLTPVAGSAMHRVRSDEIYHFYAGDPIELLLLRESARSELVVLGPDLAGGEKPQVVVPGGTWQGAHLCRGGAWALLGMTVAPGFEFQDFEMGDAEALAAGWPDRAALIRELST
jgi:predicted cupin superfamily sugar epimerase